MEFFNNTRNFGLIVTLLSIADIVIGIFGIIDSGVDISRVGMILSAIVMLLAGLTIFTQTDGGIISFAFPEGSKSKFGALTGFIFATGLSNIALLHPLGIVLGLIFIFIGWSMTNNKRTFIDSIVWVILIVLYALAAIGSLLVVFTGELSAIIEGLLSSILFLMAFLYLLDEDVKNKLV